jgi:hypothetical protein
MKRLVTVALAVVATASVLAAIAPAHTKKYGGSLSIAKTDTGYAGAINGKPVCEKNRKVKVEVQLFGRLATGSIKPGGKPGGPGSPTKPVGSAVTDNSGNWSVTDSSDFPPGTEVIASVEAKRLKRNSAHLHLCKARTASLTN